MQQHITEFALQIVKIFGINGLNCFIGFFNQVVFDALVSLFAIPGALFAKNFYDFNKIFEVLRGFSRFSHFKLKMEIRN